MSHQANVSPPDVELATVSRGGLVESVHRGTVVVVRGDRTDALGDPERGVWARSCVKPFQAVAGLERGVGEAFDDRELAVMSASHDGTERHVRAVSSMLAKLGLDEESLRCGVHEPYSIAARRALADVGARPRRIHNNCSGKHSGMLGLARALGEEPGGYLEPEGACQRIVRRVVADFCDLDPDGLAVAVDGCGAPTFRLPLVAIARGFRRLLNRDDLDAVRSAACARLHRAIAAEPNLYEGDGELCTELLRALPPGRIWPKNGAEGLFAFGLRRADGEVVGAAVKISDGNARAYRPVVVSLLGALGAWDAVPAGLATLARPAVENTQGRVVGEIVTTVRWPRTW